MGQYAQNFLKIDHFVHSWCRSVFEHRTDR